MEDKDRKSSLRKYLYLVLTRLTFRYLVFRLTVLEEDCRDLCRIALVY